MSDDLMVVNGTSGYNPFLKRRLVKSSMQTMRFVHWQDGEAFLGYLLDYPDYCTQGDSFEDLKDHLLDLYRDLTSGELPGIRKVDELVVP